MLMQPRVASAEVITGYQEASFSPYVKAESVILHPGEVGSPAITSLAMAYGCACSARSGCQCCY